MVPLSVILVVGMQKEINNNYNTTIDIPKYDNQYYIVYKL